MAVADGAFIVDQGEVVMRTRMLVALLPLCLAAVLYADGPGDNVPDKVRPVPPAGVDVPQNVAAELQEGVDALGKEIDNLHKSLAKKPDQLELLPDVQIYYNAVRYALKYKEFYGKNKKDLDRQFDTARDHLKKGKERAEQLKQGKSPWTTATGLVARGYVSKIDGSVQPYGVLVPSSYTANTPLSYRLDVWCHGRGEDLTELKFIDNVQKNGGPFQPTQAFVLQLYGRYCCANKFAGEIDCLEALEQVRKNYSLDDNRIVMRGFSMGGAACWQFAVHYPSMWCAAAPGAGFSETADFLKVFQDEKVKPTWYEKKLWHLYDCTDYAGNLYNCPVVAYSGEIDKQKQAADMMAEAMKREGLTLLHIIGPKTAHAYEPKAKKEVAAKIDRLAAHGKESTPLRVKFTTYTLRYNESFWVRLDGLDQHWDRAEIDATMEGLDSITVKTKNVNAFTLQFDSGDAMFNNQESVELKVDDDEFDGPAVLSDKSWVAHIEKQKGKWKVVEKMSTELHKRHGLQGPIDDAFMDSFMIVKPSGKAMNEKVGKWVDAEMERAITQWRSQFRGEPRVKNDADTTDKDIAEHNLVLWGDPQSNAILAKIKDKLPINWGDKEIVLGQQKYTSEEHVPVLIYPNPLNPKKYVVLNSGFTFREYDYLNNARQVPKLPDWAIIDLKTPPSARFPGAIPAAGFFDDHWKLSTKELKEKPLIDE
jgi:Prolyl oligopeptidase family